MKKKFLICTLCFTIIFSSLNIKKSYANPLVLTKVAEVSIIYSIGRLAFDTVGFIGTVADIMDLGGNIYSKMTSKQKDDYKNSVKFEDDKFTYSDDSYSHISSYVPESQGQHLMKDVKKTYIPNPYHEDNITYTEETIAPIFDEYKDTINIQGYDYDFLLHRKNYYSSNDSVYQYYLFYKPTNEPLSSLKRINGRHDNVPYMYFKLYISSLYKTTGTLTLDWYYGNDQNLLDDSKNTFYKKQVLDSNIPNTCDNCPHDISLKPSYKYPTSSELNEIEKNYPQYENDILVPGDVSTGGGSTGGGAAGGGSTGGGSNGNINNSPIISNPPSFPNLQEFDFSGLQLEPLTNLFSNFKNKFPFSLPFDLANLIGGLKQEPIPPVFETELLGETMTLDLTQFSELANLVRMFTVLSYVISLVLLTKRFGG